MYNDYYKLRETPFNQSVDPKFTWLSEKKLLELSAFKKDYADQKGFYLITGDAGTGKTAFVKRLIAEIESQTIVATVTDPDLGKLDFFNWLSLEFDLDVMFKSKGAFLTRFKRFLLDASQKNLNVALIIDDAHRINQELVDEILTLSSIGKADDKLMSIFLVGHTGFKKILHQKQNSALKQSINAHFHLKPLSEDEVAQLISYRLKVAAAKSEIFTSRAIHEIFQFSAGYPRMVINICDRAMIAGCVSATHLIDKDIIVECAKDLQIAGFKREVNGADQYDKFSAVNMPDGVFAEEKNQEIKKTHVVDWKIKIAAAARSAVLPVFIAILVIAAIYFAFHFKSVLLSWASITFNQENSTSASVEPSSVSIVPKKEIESEMNVQLAVNDDDKLVSSEEDQPESPPSSDESDKPRIDEKNSYRDNQNVTPSDTASTQPTVVSDLLDENANDEPLIIASKPETAASSAAEKTLNEIISEKMDLNTEQLSSASSNNEIEKELAEKEFKLLSRRLALKSKLTKLEQQVTDVQEVRLEPKIGRLILAEPAGDLQARKNVDPLQPMDKRIYLPEKERQAANIHTTGLAPDGPGGDKVGDTVPTDVLKPQENTQFNEPVPKPLKLPPKDTQSADTSSTPQAISKELGVSDAIAANDSKLRLKDISEQTVPDKPPVQAPVVKPELDPVAKTPHKSGAKVAALGNAIQNEDLDNRQRLKERLQSFLEVYCHTYETKDLDHFATFFASNALENEKPFHDLLPKYRHNFNVIEFINYRIEMQKFDYDTEFGTIDLEGRFFLEWLPGDSKWRRNSGKIFIKLQDLGTSFKISKLNYYGDQRKKSR